MPTFGWQPGDAKRREERRITEDRRRFERRAPLRPYPLMSVPTQRQLQVLSLLAQGLTTKEVARELELSPHTVKQQTRNICQKVNARNAIHAVAICFAQKWLIPNR